MYFYASKAEFLAATSPFYFINFMHICCIINLFFFLTLYFLMVTCHGLHNFFFLWRVMWQKTEVLKSIQLCITVIDDILK